MCGRYHQTAPPERLANLFDLDIRDNFPARYNVAPTQPISVIRRDEAGRRAYALMRWGFIPSWATREYHARMGSRPLINARADTIADKPAFRHAWRRRRCLVPATGFYEWKSEGGGKQPYCIVRASEDLFAFAGVWETARDPDGGEIDTVAILTTDAGADLAALHHREPVVIPPDDYQRWLQTGETETGSLAPLVGPAPFGSWRYFAVSKAVNHAKNDGAELIAPLPSPPLEKGG